MTKQELSILAEHSQNIGHVLFWLAGLGFFHISSVRFSVMSRVRPSGRLARQNLERWT